MISVKDVAAEPVYNHIGGVVEHICAIEIFEKGNDAVAHFAESEIGGRAVEYGGNALHRTHAVRRFAARNNARADRRTDLIVTAENKFAAPANPKLTLNAFLKFSNNAARRHGTGKQRFGDAERLQNLR